jgi:hypothetical protein
MEDLIGLEANAMAVGSGAAGMPATVMSRTAPVFAYGIVDDAR